MSRTCPITGKGPVSGNTRSHSLAATRRRWNVNLQKYKINIDGKMVEVRMSARAYRTLNKTTAQKAVAAPKEDIKAEVKPVKKAVAKKAETPKEEKVVEAKKEAK